MKDCPKVICSLDNMLLMLTRLSQFIKHFFNFFPYDPELVLFACKIMGFDYKTFQISFNKHYLGLAFF